MPSRRPIYKNCDMRLRLTNLKNADKETVSDATVTFVINDLVTNGQIASGTAEPVVGVAGAYQVTVDKDETSQVVIDRDYEMVITCEDNEGDETEFIMELYGARNKK